MPYPSQLTRNGAPPALPPAASIGQCGACTVLLDGRRVNSCLTFAVAQQDAEIVTIEGLANEDGLHPVQEAFLEHDGYQCGYCTPGQVFSPSGMLYEVASGLSGAEQIPEARFAYGAHFVEVRVDIDTAEVRLSHMLSVFAAGRIMNPRLARSQFIGGMTMGLSMALHEEGLMDAQFGDHANHDLAEYHVAVNADIPDLHWLDEFDDELNPMGGKGIGEIGIVGTAAAVANAVAHATGHRVRDLPIRPDKLLAATARFASLP